jgi:hypothetical protein
MPLWIRQDWEASIPWPFNKRRFGFPVQMAYYRDVYAKAMGEALGL